MERSEVDKIERFAGEYAFLSNFHPSPVTFEGQEYATVEHAFQAAKTLHAVERQRVQNAASPKQARQQGRRVTLRPDWDALRLDVMSQLVRKKFMRHGDLRAKLLATGEAELVEGNTWGDHFWGVCEGKGENHLGRILMQVRAELRERLNDL